MNAGNQDYPENFFIEVGPENNLYISFKFVRLFKYTISAYNFLIKSRTRSLNMLEYQETVKF